MTDQSASGLPGRPRVDTITFNEDELQAVVLDNREVVLPVRAVCGVLGLDPDTAKWFADLPANQVARNQALARAPKFPPASPHR